jgi:ATP-dependent Lhr-like helicase
MLLETTRECVRDLFDVPALREVMADLRARRTRLVAVETDKASPFSQSLLFSWIAVYMYEGDAPLAERRAAALSLDRDLLRELLGTDELRELLDPRALDEVELELQRLADGRHARHADGVHDLLRDLGPLGHDEIRARADGDADAMLGGVLEDGRAIRVRVAGDDRYAAVEDAARLRDALGVSLPLGVPGAFTAAVEQPLEDLVARYARTHGPFTTGEIAARLGAGRDRVRGALERLQTEGRVVHGAFRPDGIEPEWCEVDVLRRIRARSLAALRREVEPVGAAALARFLPAWQGADRPRGGADALPEAIARLQGAAIPASILESDVLPARVRGFRPADLDALCASGDLVWVGAGALGATDGRVSLLYRDRAGLLAPIPRAAEDRPARPLHDAIRERLAARGASFWPDLVEAAGTANEATLLRALWDLVWAGEVTNDTLAPLRASIGGTGSRRPRAGRGSAQRPRPGTLRRAGPPAGAGRWSLVTDVVRDVPGATERAHALAAQLLDRHGVVTREATLAEGTPGGFAAVYPVLKLMEETGAVRRGYFVAGLGAAQFAHPGAVDRIRTLREGGVADDEVVTLAAADPAQPYGAALAWPETAGRPSRSAGAYVVLANGEPTAFLERGAKTLVTFGADPGRWADALAELVKDGRVRRIELRQIDGTAAGDHPAAALLREVGFVDGYRGLTLRG